MLFLRRLFFLSLPPPYPLPAFLSLSQLTPSNLAYILYKRFKIDIWTSVFLYLSDILSKIGISFMVGKLMSSFLEQKREEEMINFFWLIGFLLVHLVVGQHNWLILTRLSNGIKISVLCYLHRKIFSIPCYYLTKKNSNIYGLISSDIAQLENKATYLLALIMTPFTLLLSSLLLFSTILPSSFRSHIPPPASSSTPSTFLSIYPLLFVLILFLSSILIIFLVQFLLAKWNYAAFSNKSNFTQSRLKAMHELVDHIRVLRMLNWQYTFKNEIFNCRKKEVESLALLNLLLGANKLLAKLSPFLLIALLLPLLSSCSFSSPSAHPLESSSTIISFRYSILHLFDFISLYTIMYFGLGLLTLLEFQVTFAKVALILSLPENQLKITNYEDKSREIIDRKDDKEKNGLKKEKAGKKNGKENRLKIKAINRLDEEKVGINEEIVIDLKEFSAGYEKGTDVLSKINLTIRKGQKLAILGKVGSGKSSLLLSLIGEMPIVKGRMEIRGNISLVQQNPFFLKGSLIENIAFYSNIEKNLMKKVVGASGLEKEVNEEGEREIGEKGEMLSGGQKARVSLARAIYNGGDIFLLDDPFSSLDSKMGKEIFLSSIFGVLKEKTVILATNRTDFLEKMDRILILNDRKIIESNQKKNYRKRKDEDDERVEAKKRLEKEENLFSRDKKEKKKEEGINEKSKAFWKMKLVEEKEKKRMNEEEIKKNDYRMREEKRMKNRSAFSIFLEYISYRNRKMLLIVILLFLGAERLKVEMIKSLVDKNFNYGLLGWLITISLMKNYAFNFHFLRINTKIHDNIIKKIANAEISYFDQNSVNQIISRFSTDLSNLDSSLPSLRDSFDFLSSTLSLFFSLFFSPFVSFLPFPSSSSPISRPSSCFLPLALFFPSLIFLYFHLKNRIIKAKREELTSRIALTSNFGESLTGMTSIRVFKRERVFQEIYEEILVIHSKANCKYWGEMRVYTVWLELLGIMFCGGCLLGMISLERGEIGVKMMDEEGGTKNTLGEMGQMIVMLLQITEILQYGFNLLISIELLMSSVEKLLSFLSWRSLSSSSLTPSISSTSSSFCSLLSPSSSPSSSNCILPPLIEFREVSFSYTNLPLILDNISFSLYPFERLAFIGQSGCGKTSLLNLLFGLVKPTSGNIFLNENCSIPLKVSLNGSSIVSNHISNKSQLFLTIVPQENTIFSGTVRRNLDPKGEFSDQKLCEVLEMVLLGKKKGEERRAKKERKGKKQEKEEKEEQVSLDIEAERLSRGQRQLLWLARVLLDKAEVVVMDEATGGLDGDTEASVFKTVIERIKIKSLLIVAHRLTTVAQCDRVIVLKQGRIAEQGSPSQLLMKKGEFYDMVNNCGDRTRKNIEEIIHRSNERRRKKI